MNKNPNVRSLDDGQPLVEFAPLKPAEFARDHQTAILQGNVGIANLMPQVPKI